MDSGESTASFYVDRMAMSAIRGTFTNLSGTFSLAEGDAAPSIEVQIPTATLDTPNRKRERDMRGPDFFDVARYPEIRFRSRNWERTGEGRYRIHGAFTLRGVTKDTVADAIVKRTEDGAAEIVCEFTIKRSDYGMTKLIPIVSNTVQITARIIAERESVDPVRNAC